MQQLWVGGQEHPWAVKPPLPSEPPPVQYHSAGLGLRMELRLHWSLGWVKIG